MYLGDIAVGATIHFMFTTRRFSTGAPHTLAGTPAVRVYKNASDVEDDSGITLNVDYDSRTGLNQVTIDTSADGTFYAAGSNCMVVITAGTVDSVSVVGEVVAHFSISNRPVQGLAANVITAASMNADASGEIADAVWDEDATGHQTGGTFGQAIGDPGADTNTIFKAVVTDAAGATIGLDIVDVEGKVDDLESRLGTPSDLGSGATVAANLVDIESQTDDIGVAGAGLTNINLPDQTMNITGDITGNLSGSVGSVTGNVGGNVAGSVGSVTGNVGGNVAGSVGSVTGNVGGNVTGSVGSVATGGIAAASFAAGAIDASAIATNAIGSDELAASAITEIQSGLATAVDLATVDTVVDAIKAKTDSLTFTVAGQVDSNIQYVNDTQVTGDGQTGTEWGPA